MSGAKLLTCCLAALACPALASWAADPLPEGTQGPCFVVEEVLPGSAADLAGLKAGDCLIGWERAAAPPANPEPATGRLADAFDLQDVSLDQRPRGLVTLLGQRGGELVRAEMVGETWGLKVHNPYPPALEELYQLAREAEAAGRLDEAVHAWQELTALLVVDGQFREATITSDRLTTYWRSVRNLDRARESCLAAIASARASGSLLVEARQRVNCAQLWSQRGEARETVEEMERVVALRDAFEPRSVRVGAALQSLGSFLLERGELDAAERAFEETLAIYQRLAPDHLVSAEPLIGLGNVASRRGDAGQAEELHRRALALTRKLAPTHRLIGMSLHNLGTVAYRRGDLAQADEWYRQALAFRQEYEPGTLNTASTLNNMAATAWDRGRLAEAESLQREAQLIRERIAPERRDTALGLGQLAEIARRRGDPTAAEGYLKKALTIMEKAEPEGLEMARLLAVQAEVAIVLGQLETARNQLQRSLKIRRAQASGSLDEADSLGKLAHLALVEGDITTAEARCEEALAIVDRRAPQSLHAAQRLAQRADIAQKRGDAPAAERWLVRSLEILKQLAPGSRAEADSAFLLGKLVRRAGRRGEALAYLEEAADATDRQRASLGGLDSQAYAFAAGTGEVYFELLDLLVETGRAEAAFHVLERLRARTFLAALHRRELVFARDLPGEIDRERRQADAHYDQVFGRLAEASAESPEELEGLRKDLAAARLVQQDIKARLRAAAPTFAALEDPEPLYLSAAQATLVPGELLVAYAVGPERTHLFAFGQSGDLEVHTLSIGRLGLLEEVRRLRTLIVEGGPNEAVVQVASRLANQLLGPAAKLLESCHRLIVVPDGPLHDLPFSALIDPSSPPGAPHYLIERLAVHKVTSATVLAELLARRRAEPRPFSLVAFGDPAYPAPASEPGGEVELAAAVRSGLSLAPLPASRVEVEALARLFPGEAEVWTGSEANEEKVKSLSKGPRFLHFACHGFADERLPLESGLALSIPVRSGDGENGYLQAWEILEQMRIDAELVTLSACETARGADLGGEGILGLTRAFQHAGAASVLASLWTVGDASTSALMVRFYSGLKAGLGKAEALRQAQLTLLRGEDGGAASHPFAWAGFELIGEGR